MVPRLLQNQVATSHSVVSIIILPRVLNVPRVMQPSSSFAVNSTMKSAKASALMVVLEWYCMSNSLSSIARKTSHPPAFGWFIVFRKGLFVWTRVVLSFPFRCLTPSGLHGIFDIHVLGGSVQHVCHRLRVMLVDEKEEFSRAQPVGEGYD